MNTTRTLRRARRALGVAGCAAGLLPATALAGPVQEVAQDFNAGAYQVGASIFPQAGAILGARGAAVVYQPGHHAGHRYCNPFGPATRLTEIRIRAIRWHTQSLTGFMRVNTPAGESWRMTSDSMPVGHHNYGFVGAGGAGPGECVALEYYQSGATQGGSGWNPTFTAQMDAVRVEDLQGPSVGGLSATPSWVTGNEVYLEWDHADNSLGRGGTGARVAGGGEVGLGDPGNGRSGANVSVGALPDGTHTVYAFRDGAGWARHELGTSFRLDRHAPVAPTLTLTPDAGWTNQPVLVTSTQTGDGTGSGWARNALSNGATNSTSIVAEGETTLTARSVDNAGNVSAPGAPRTVRIDKTPPIAALVATRKSPGTIALDMLGTTDALSGLRSTVVRLNGPDGLLVGAHASELQDVGAVAPAKNAGNVRFHLTATDNAGNTASHLTPVIRLDATPPRAVIDNVPQSPVSGFSAPGQRIGVSLSDTLPDGLGRVEVQIRQGQGVWQTLQVYNAPGHPDLAQGSHQLAPPLSGAALTDGPAEVRLIAKDPVISGHESVSTPSYVMLELSAKPPAEKSAPGSAKVQSEGTGVSTGGALVEEEAAFLTDIRVTGTVRTRKIAGRSVPVAAVLYGTEVSIRGVLRLPDGRGDGRRTLGLYDSQGRLTQQVTTGADGAFGFRATVGPGGVWWLARDARSARYPVAVFEVTPKVGARMSIEAGSHGRRLAVTGLLGVGPHARGKRVQLQWKDPRSGWRPVADARTGSRGRFSFRYLFRRSGGYTVTLRVVVPQERGWPYRSAVTKPQAVRVG
jgi:hypothetical protein